MASDGAEHPLTQDQKVAQRIRDCAAIMERGCGIAGPNFKHTPAAGSADPLDCPECAAAFVHSVQDAMSGQNSGTAPIPTFISYCPTSDRAFVWLKGGAAPGEITRSVATANTCLSYDAAGHLVLIEMPGDALHPDLVPHAARDYPAEGNL